MTIKAGDIRHMRDRAIGSSTEGDLFGVSIISWSSNLAGVLPKI